MSEFFYFKHWNKAIGSATLNALTDHEERVWWRLLALASGQENRWHIGLTPHEMAYSLHSTPPKLRASFETFRRHKMITDEPGGFVITNWQEYQENPSTERVRQWRAKRYGNVTETVTATVPVTPVKRPENREQRTDPLVPNGTKGDTRQKRATAITPEFLDRMRAKHPTRNVDEDLLDAQGHKRGLASWSDKQRGFDNWLTRAESWAAERNTNGRATTAKRNSPDRHRAWTNDDAEEVKRFIAATKSRQ